MSIEAIASAVPSISENSESLAQQTGADEDFIRDKVGVHTRYRLGPGETGVDLAATAVRRLFNTTDLNPEDVGFLIYVTQNPDQRIPHNAPKLADCVELPTTLASFDLSLGCSGFVYALATMEAFLEAQGIDNGLLITCDPYSRIMAAEDRATNAVFGDAAAATWVSRNSKRTRLIGCDFGTDGSGGQAIRINAGGATQPMIDFKNPYQVRQYERNDLHLHMDGRDVFNFVNQTIPKSFSTSLEKAGFTIADIDFFALHQGSLHMLKTLARRSGIPDEKLLINIGDYGNTVSSTVPMLLETIMKEQNMSGKRVMVSGFGVGLSWATGILEFT